MEVAKPSLREILDRGQVLNIPLFQRSYAWRKKNWTALLDDVMSLVNNDHSHFMGALVFAPDQMGVGQLPKYQVIDGQQRISTLSIMLCALRDLAHERDDLETASEIEDYLHNKKGKGNPDLKFKIRPRYRDRADYIALVQRGNPVGQSAMPQAYKFFRDGFAKELGTDGLKCQNILDPVMDCLRFVSITMGQGENHYEIFRSLNFLGVDLRVGDLIRNYVFMSVPGNEQEDFDENHWRKLEKNFLNEKEELNGPEFEKFFRYALRRKGEYFRDSDAYLKFEKQHPVKSIQENREELVDEYRELSIFWGQMNGGRGSSLPGDENINDALRRIGSCELDIQVARPLMMRLLELKSGGQLSDAKVAEAFQLISGFFLRRHVCRMNSRGYGQWFCEVCGQLGDNPIENLRAFLVERREGWPNDEQFEAAFLTCDLYSLNYCKAILCRMERALWQYHGRPNVPVILEECWVEHVMPQSLTDEWKTHMGEDADHHKKWLHTPGNLTLLGKECNQEISNKPFEEKLSHCLRDNILRLNNDFNCSENNWRIKQIRNRGIKLAKLAAKIWPGAGQ